MTEINTYIGKAAKMLRQKIDLTQQDMANLLGMSRSNYVNLETGRINCLPDNLYKLCRVLKCQPNDLFPKVKPAQLNFSVEKVTKVKEKKKYLRLSP